MALLRFAGKHLPSLWRTGIILTSCLLMVVALVLTSSCPSIRPFETQLQVSSGIVLCAFCTRVLEPFSLRHIYPCVHVTVCDTLRIRPLGRINFLQAVALYEYRKREVSCSWKTATTWTTPR